MPKHHDGFAHRVSRSIHDRLSPHSPSRPRSAGEDAYLSYHDVRLTYEDVNTLGHDEWLTDNVISFWQEYLEHDCIAKHKRCKVRLLRPSMAFMLMQAPDVTMLRGVLPPLEDASHIFLPINNNTNVEQAEGGTHWSLLLVSINDKVAFHYDSLSGSNENYGKLATEKLEALLSLDQPIRYVNIENAPQQHNSSDCGVFVCLLMKHLLVKKLLVKHMGEQVDMGVDNKEVHAARGRREIKSTIDGLRDQGQRIRSSSRSSRSRSTSPPRIGPETEGT